MLLAIDIGNTRTTVGVFDNEELRATWHIATDRDRMSDEYAALLLNLLQHHDITSNDIDEIALCSVVPLLRTIFEEMFHKYFHHSPLVIEAGVKTGVRIRMDNPREVGPDRIANAAAAHHLYGGPIIVIDLGTATTFDTVSQEGDYLGGAVAPGISAAADALFRKTAMLPAVELVPPKHAIGTNTITAMQSGIVYGYVGLIEGIVSRIQKELTETAKVVATGGYAELLAKETNVIDDANPDLTLIGIRIIHSMNRH